MIVDPSTDNNDARRRQGSENNGGGEEVFRRRRVWLDEGDERNDLWTIKRANPLTSNSDGGELVCNYTRPSSEIRVQRLAWTDRLPEERIALPR